MTERKKHTTVTISQSLLEWIKEEIEKKRFASISHAVEYSLWREKERSQANSS